MPSVNWILPFDIEAAKVWIIDNQKGRRNLTDGWKWELAQTRKAILAEKGKENKLGRGKVLSNIDKTNTQKEIADELGWSTGKVAMADKVWKEAEPEIKEQIKVGDVSINEAYQNVTKPHSSNVCFPNDSKGNIIKWFTIRDISSLIMQQSCNYTI